MSKAYLAQQRDITTIWMTSLLGAQMKKTIIKQKQQNHENRYIREGREREFVTTKYHSQSK